MKVLALDTSAQSGSVAALEWNSETAGVSQINLRSEFNFNAKATRHSEKLMWAIDQALFSAGWKVSEVDLFAVGLGPGSFTGLRIGVTTARTLAHSLNKPLVGVSSLAALSYPVAQWLNLFLPNTLVLAVNDACKGELFAFLGKASEVVNCQTFSSENRSLWNPGVLEDVFSPQDLLDHVENKRSSKDLSWCAVGDGVKVYPSLWDSLPTNKRVIVPDHFFNQVQGRYIGTLAIEAFCNQVKTNALEVTPRYLRASQAEMKLKKGELVRQPVSD